MSFLSRYVRKRTSSPSFKYIAGIHIRHLKCLEIGLLLLCLLMLLLYFIYYTSYVHFPTNSDRSNIKLYKVKSSTPPCVPKKHIMFLKTHKCASSTVQNIFLRYGYNHNLTFALPEKGNYLGNPGQFKYSMIPSKLLPASGKVDIFAVHTRLSFDHDKVLHSDSIWLTVVRDPVFLYESLYNYYNLNQFYKISLEDLVKLPMEKLLLLPRYGGKLGKNQMFFDLGYEDNMTAGDIQRAIGKIENDFNLVLISELLDESLILLRHYLCWTMNDVVFFTKNVRRKEVKKHISEPTRKLIRLINSADSFLYEHFLQRHKTSVVEFGRQRMAKEVAKLKEYRFEYFKRCGVKVVRGKDQELKFKEYSGLVSAYALSNDTDVNCHLLSLPELHLIDIIRKKQVKVINNG